MIKLKQRLSGFFQAQMLKLRLQRMKKWHQQRKSTSTKSVYNQIPSPMLKKHRKIPGNPPKHGKMSSNYPNSLVDGKNYRNSLVATKMPSSSSSSSSTPMPLVESNYPLILKKHRKRPDNQLRNKGRSIYDLPEELLAEILVRLPVKYILRCRCVRKSWYYLIKTPMFITYQLNYQKKFITHNLNPKYLFFKTEYTHALTLRFDDVQCQEYCTLKCLPGLPDIAWHALSYGLICVSTTLFHSPFEANPNIYLWNPLVQKYKTLPDSPLPFGKTVWKALAFGFVPEINDYVVVHIVKPRLLLGRREEPDPHSVIIGVYSLNTNSWKKICQDNVFIRYISFNDAVFLNGTAFWLGISWDRSQILVCFDTKTNILGEISLPSRVDMPVIPVIHLFGQSIAYFVWDNGFDYFDMWVLKYDSISEFSWEKKMSVCPTEDIRVQVLGVRNNGEPIVTKSYNLISYNLDNHVANNFVDSWDRWTPFPYYEEGFAPPFFVSPFVESLVLLDID